MHGSPPVWPRLPLSSPRPPRSLIFDGVTVVDVERGKLVPDHLERLFRCLDEVTKQCPQGCHKRLPLASMIVHLNDDHRLTREQIAEWLTQESNA